ncbi:MAG TPA: hypothetical protein EYP61_07410 [Candidatus Latescibacteria bacterium]|nr:hypothetical protein [Candidatus Latescibacterota bacterium]
MFALVLWLGLLGPPAEAGSSEVCLSFAHFDFGERSLKDATAYLVRYTYELTNRYALQGSLGMSFSSFSGSVEGESVQDEPATVFVWYVSVLYKFRITERLRSFTAMGIGGMTRHIRSFRPEGRMTFNFGGGLKFLPDERVVLSFGIRSFFSSVSVGGFLPSSGFISFWPSGTREVLEVSGGLGVMF